MNARQRERLASQLGPRDHLVLDSVERFRLLTTRHLQRLHFFDHASDLAAARACSRALRRLQEIGMVIALERRVGGVRKGSASYVWQLSSTGEAYQRALRGRARRRRYVEPGGLFVKHTLAVNDLAVGLLEASRETGGFTVEQLVVEPANWRSYLGPGGETSWLKPDLHLVAAVTEPNDSEAVFEEHAFIEIDLGTEHLPRIQAKCRTYAFYAATGTYQAAHGLFPAVVWLSPDPARQAALRAAVADASGLPEDALLVSSPDYYLNTITGRT